MRRVAGVRVLLLCGTLCAPAAAQLPVHGFVEPCTVANMQESGTRCEQCSVVVSDRDACSRRFSPLGYTRKCRTHGESATKWAEVWCSSKPTPPAGPARPSAVAALVAGALVALGTWLYLKRSRPPAGR